MLLKDKMAFFDLCFDSMQIGILICNKRKEIVLANDRLAGFFGYSRHKKKGTEFPIELDFGFVHYENEPYYKAMISDISTLKEKEEKSSYPDPGDGRPYAPDSFLAKKNEL